VARIIAETAGRVNLRPSVRVTLPSSRRTARFGSSAPGPSRERAWFGPVCAPTAGSSSTSVPTSQRYTFELTSPVMGVPFSNSSRPRASGAKNQSLEAANMVAKDSR
jgi:hypothetical protein